MTGTPTPDPATRIRHTYDPILHTAELRRFRVTPLRSPAAGTALVLERAIGEPLVIRSGDPIPDARTGNYRRMHLIDVSNQGLSFTMLVPGADPGFYLQVTVSFSCQIADPAAIARDGVHDMTAALVPSLTRIVRKVATTFDLQQLAAAEAAITSSLNVANRVLAVRLSAFAVTVEAGEGPDIGEQQVQDMRREAMRLTLQRDEASLHHLATHREDVAALLDRELDTRDRNQASLEALRELLLSRAELEEYEPSRITEQALSTFFPHTSLIPSERGGLYERLDRQAHLDRWIAAELSSLIDALDYVLDVDAGLRDAYLPTLRADVEGALDDVLDVEAGLCAILPTAAFNSTTGSDEYTARRELESEPQQPALLAVDMESIGGRDNKSTLVTRRALFDAVRSAFKRSGIAWNSSEMRDTGDGLIAIVPPTFPKTKLISAFLDELADELHRHNMISAPETRIRVRVALHAGEVRSNKSSLAGSPVVLLARLLNSAQLRSALKDAPDAPMALIVSDSFYQDVVAHGAIGNLDRYVPVQVQLKEATAQGWLRLT